MSKKETGKVKKKKYLNGQRIKIVVQVLNKRLLLTINVKCCTIFLFIGLLRIIEPGLDFCIIGNVM